MVLASLFLIERSSLVASSITSTPNFSFTTDIPGFYDVELIITSASSCTDTLRRSQYLHLDEPKASFDVQPVEGSEPLIVNFEIQTENVTEFEIDFGDSPSNNTTIQLTNSDSITTTISHTYSAGMYFPILKIRDSLGCERILEMDTVDVTPFNVDFRASDTFFCGSGTVQFDTLVLSTMPIDSILWKFKSDVDSFTSNVLPF